MCGTCLQELDDRYGDRWKLVTLPRYYWVPTRVGKFLAWRQSFATTRKRGLLLLKGDQVRHVLGLEVVCTCGSRAQSREER